MCRLVSLAFVLVAASLCSADVPVDLKRYDPKCGVDVQHRGDRLYVAWPLGDKETGRLALDLRPNEPLIESVSLAAEPLLRGVEPLTFLTIGTRKAPAGRPPEMSKWNVFFDKPASRPYQQYLSKRETQQVRVTSEGRRANVVLDGLRIGPFRGELVLTVYPGARLLHVEAVVSTEEDERAILYDTGLVGDKAGWQKFAWLDTEGQLQRAAADVKSADRPLAVRHRALIAETNHGSVACFPPPHQYQFPRDWTDNLKFAWIGRDHNKQTHPLGFGIRQVADGGRAFEPWFNAPPKTQQRLGVFYLLSAGKAEDALRETLRYTHGDRFPTLPGQVTFTTHYHMAVAVTAMNRKGNEVPEFVKVFKDMGVQAVHLGDFHGDGHPKDAGPLRLPELEMLFRECERLSDRDFLLMPGEEINEFLGLKEKGKHPGHWMSYFPKPVYWTQVRAAEQPFVENHPRHGKVYHVGSREDMVALLKAEKGLAWSAHPRIKASNWTPDIFREEDFYLADFWVGGAWKAMPAELSRERLGERCLDLLDDMANWGQKKYLPGEVDVFKIDHTHELYGHMNINYLRLDKLPRYEDGWQPILDAVQTGKFFTTTGEVLLHEFTVGGKQSGETLKAAERPEVRVALEWTFPLKFAEVISGDGQKVYRERIDLADTEAFGKRTLTLRPELRDRKWVRFEVWDVAANGAYTQPVWLANE